MKKWSRILLLFCFACSQKPDAPAVHADLINGNRSLRLKGLDYAIVSEINRDSVPGRWESLLPVYKMPADTDLKSYQPVQPGTYTLKDSSVMFTPDTPFIKGKTYFMRYYRFEGTNIWDYIKEKKHLGEARYTDMPFKP